ncbi:Nucleoporin nup57 [Ophidiomyces ophidiicola]|uniref:Nucleoporin nup57 n=1 Tax=Ophidiomyces ophidiicola TaxID=1387563 RepID=UPI0020C2F17C|nr:Nucleoporin nup57 [Ophidiomyces ophidiicola]KAI1953893.1 Nucleoporin nup57 [Ophidiomyces ophidiicola]KAI2062690.1 Nucleoporin nup57 [Ophidiomyces ophidiicola]
MSQLNVQKPRLFGSGLTANQPQQSGSLFGNTEQQQNPSPFGSLGTQSKPGGLFSNLGQQQQPQTQQQNAGPFSGFGSSTQQPQQQSGGLFSGFGSTAQPPQQQRQGTSLFSGFGAQPQQQQAQGGSNMFASLSTATPQTQQQAGSLLSGFGSTAQQPQQQSGATSLFSGFGQQQPQQQQQPFGSTVAALGQQQAPQQLGQTLGQSQGLGSTIWTPGQGMTGVHRTVPMQMTIVREKWDPVNRVSPFRGYTYNNPGEETAPFFQPTVDDDENKWEEALRKRPGPNFVPVLVRGFWELGKRAQRQRDFLAMIQTRLHEINTALTGLLSRHDLNISVKIAACKRRHQVLYQRCLALAAKTQLLRNRGYAMDEAEEELAKKLLQLERSIFDPTLNGRSEEIWARMLAIRENIKRLQMEVERTGTEALNQGDDTLSDAQLKTAKKILDDYSSQIQHLNKELAAIQTEYGRLEVPVMS